MRCPLSKEIVIIIPLIYMVHESLKTFRLQATQQERTPPLGSDFLSEK